MKPIRLALAEDNRLVRKGLVHILQSLDQLSLEVVLEAANGKELLTRLETQPVDIVLMDVDMPEMGGIEATSLIRTTYPEVRVLALSVHTEDHFILDMIRAGARGYLTKDEEPDEVARAIQLVMDTGYYFNQGTSRAIHLQMAHPNLQDHSPDLAQLKPQHVRSLQLICEQKRTAEIADLMCVSERTVEGYRQELLEKTGAINVAGLVIFAIKNGYYQI